MKQCRFCGTELKHGFIDLGLSPVANSYVKEENVTKGEVFYPLCTHVCHQCFLVQLDVFESPEDIFTEYAYFSSFSNSWLAHCKAYTELVVERFGLNKDSTVVEIASNDGYLLQYFQEKGIGVLGIEPAVNVADEARKKGIPTISEFFGVECADQLLAQGIRADLVAANNVLAHVPDINGVIQGIQKVLKEKGVFTAEFPHLLQLIENNQFDTIYHEHFSYFSFTTINTILATYGLKIFDVEQLATHGGSLRIYATHEGNTVSIKETVTNLLQVEKEKGLLDVSFYGEVMKSVEKIKRDTLSFLIEEKEKGKTIVAYGAPAKGNTMLNYCGIGKEFMDYTVDLNPYKQGLYLPGTHIPIYSPAKITETKPDYVVILPWNLKKEVMEQMGAVKEWGGKFVTFIPGLEVVE